MLKVLLCPPNYFDVIDQKNPYMACPELAEGAMESAVDRVKARSQWEILCSVLKQHGCDVETIDPVGQEELVPVLVETSEFEKAGGSCFCMKTFLP